MTNPSIFKAYDIRGVYGIDLDGISIAYPEFWFNVRGSNTEPLLRLNLEAKAKELMEEKRDEVLGIIRK